MMNAERSGTKKRKREVEIWFEEAVEIENEFNALKASIEQGGFVQNAISSGDRVAKMDATVEELMEQSNHFDGLLLEKFESRGEPRVTTKLKLFEEMVDQRVEKICAWLDTRLREIGNRISCQGVFEAKTLVTNEATDLVKSIGKGNYTNTEGERKCLFREGLPCIKIVKYKTVKAALEVGASLAPGDSRFDKLIKERDQGIAEENGVLPNKLPEAPIVVDTADAIPKVAEPAISISNQTTTLSSAKPKYRHEYYQKPDQVVVTIFAKGVPAKTVSVDFGEQILSVTIDVPGEDAYSFQPRLFGKIIPANCRYEVLSTKIEIRLAKAEAVHWASLEYSRDNVALQRINVPSGGQRPTYPSSKATKDWDKLEALVKKEEKDEKLDGDAALNKFFRDIYKDADEDTRRAMMKSFVESNGTVLSTNWKEVGAKKVEGSPPDGMEMKKWEI